MSTGYIGAIQEERFEYKGFPCVVMMQALCFRTGYVGLDKTSMYYGKNYDEIPVDCHGGLTYGDSYLAQQGDEDMWWIGFDTGHYGDGKDYDAAREMFKEYPEVIIQIHKMKQMDKMFGMDFGDIATLEYCKNQCMKIVDQLLGEEK